MLNFCATHTNTNQSFPDDTIFLELGEPGTLEPKAHPNVLNCYALNPLGRNLHQYLGGTLAMFVAKDYLQRHTPDGDDLINMMNYRSFILPQQTGNRCSDRGYNIVAPDAARPLIAGLEDTLGDRRYLLATPYSVRSVRDQYAASHVREDLDTFLRQAAQLGCISDAEIADLTRSRTLYHCVPYISVLPASVFIDIVDDLEKVALKFLTSFNGASYDGYQKRAVEFCCERLAGYLIERHLLEEHIAIPAKYFGSISRISTTGTYEPAHFSD